MLALVIASLTAVAAPALGSSGPSGGASASGQVKAPAKPAPKKPAPKPKPKPTAKAKAPARHAAVEPVTGNPFAGRGMWIWYVSASGNGSLSSIIATAHQYGISTVTIKAGDGATAWSQFNPSLVSTLHAAGIHVCAWQYVYGNYPVQEAEVGAAAVRDGADCLVIDAESRVRGQVHLGADLHDLAAPQIGASFPVALASFPYVDYHPGFPLFRVPRAGRGAVRHPSDVLARYRHERRYVYAHTYEYNRV